MKRRLIASICLLFACCFVVNVSADISDGEKCSKMIANSIGISDDSNMEIINNESLNTLEINNGNGTNTLYIFDKDIKYVDETGKINYKDTSITKITDTNKLKEGYVLSVTSNNVVSDFPISFREDGIKLDNIELVPINTDGVISSSDYQSVTYNDIYEGVNLVFKPQLEGFLAEIELSSVLDLKKIKFHISGDTPYDMYADNGSVYIVTENEYTYKLSGADILDESGQAIGCAYLSVDNSDNIQVNYVLNESIEQQQVVTTSLLMENVSVSGNSIRQITLFSEYRHGIDESYNYIGTNQDGVIARTFVKFDLTALEDIDYDKVLSASYNNFLYEMSDISEVYLVRDNCDYEDLNWVNMPSIGGKIYYQANYTSMYEDYTGNERSYYITSAVQAWLQGVSNNGIMLKNRNDEGWCKMSNDESSYTYLSVTYSNYEDTPSTKGIERSYSPYYIINKDSKKALHATEISSNGNIVQKSFDMSSYQKWDVVYDSSEYGKDFYKIKIYNSSVYLRVDFDDNNVPYVNLGSNSSDNNVLWYIVRNWDGSYKLCPRVLYFEDALSVMNESLMDNAEVDVSTATVDFSQNDDWSFVPVNRDNATLYGTRNCGRNLTSLEIKKVAKKFLFSDYLYDMYIDQSANEILHDLFYSQICYLSSHGSNSRFYCYDELDPSNTFTAIGLVNGIEYDEKTENDGSNLGEVVTVYGIKEYDANMNKLQLAFFDSCSTGSNKGNESLVGAMYEEGAHCIVSFTRSIHFNTAQEWYGYFNLVFNKSDVETSSIFADRMLFHSGLGLPHANARHVLGDAALFYNYNAIAAAGNSSSSINELGVLSATSNKEHILEPTEYELNSAYLPDADNYYITTDTSGNIYGYSNETNELAFYLMNRRGTVFNGAYPNMSDALNCAFSFISELGYSTIGFSVNTSNEYSNEYIIEFNSRSEVESGEIEKMVIYVETDKNNVHNVTFFSAYRKG